MVDDQMSLARGSVVEPPPLPEAFGKPLTPVGGGERNLTMDLLRGFALLGILISNMIYFSQPLEEMGMREELWHNSLDKLSDWFSILLVEGKFYPLFSFLFGLGFSIQLGRAALRGKKIAATFKRRLCILMFLGVCHGVFLWDGDVLFLYGACGFALLLFRDRRPKTIVIWAAVLIALPAVVILFLGLMVLLMSANPQIASEMRASMVQEPEVLYELTKAYVTGGYLDAIRYRLVNWLEITFYTALFSPSFFGMFLVGLLAGRLGYFSDPDANQSTLSRVFVLCCIAGLVINFIAASATIFGVSRENYGVWLLAGGLLSIGGPVLCLAYISGIVLLVNRIPKARIFEVVASSGRMALTNYLLQSLIATTVFYGYGLGLGGQFGRLETIFLAVFIFVAQVITSYFWLQNFRFGPMEWLWRSATYRELQPMRR